MMQRRLPLLLLGSFLLSVTTAQGAAVTVRHPAFGLPHIFADTDLELARENGRQIARDRLAQIILLARVGRGTLYQAFGALDPSTLQDDIEARRTAYTSKELNAMYARLPERERDAILAYCKGVNDTIDAIYAGTLPEPLEVNILRSPIVNVDFDLFGNRTNISDQVDPFYADPNGEWPNAGFQFTPELVVAIAILEVRNFGIGGFDEATLLAQLQALIAKHGTGAGTEIWDDLNFVNDPLAPVTVPDPTTPGYGGPVAAAAPASRLAALAGRFPRHDYAGAMAELAARHARRAEFATSLGAWPMLGSYAWVIAGGKSATGYPWVGGFPQTGIQTPSLMHFAENRSAEGASHRVNGIGMEFAGAGPVILIGQTDSVAFTTTTAQLKIIDTFLDQIVNEDSDVLHYLDEGTAAPLVMRTEIFRGNPLAAQASAVFWRTHERSGDKGSRPVSRFIGDEDGNDPDGKADGGSATTLVDADPNVDTGPFDASFVGGHVAIVDGAGAGQIRAISAVPDSKTLTVGSAWTTPPDATSAYVAVKPGNHVMAVAIDTPTWLEEVTTAIGFIGQQRAESILDIRAAIRTIPSTHNFLAADNTAFNGIGTMSGSGNIGYWSSGFARKRQGGLDPRLPMDGTQPTNPLVVASGTIQSAGPASLVATGDAFAGKSLGPPAFNFRYENPTELGSEYIVSVFCGQGCKQTRRIASNTDNSLVVEFPWGGDPSPSEMPEAGDRFEVYEIAATPEAINPAEGYMANWNNKAATADESDNFGREWRHAYILERLAAENAWDRDKQRQLNKDVAGFDGKGKLGRFLVPRLRQAIDRVGNGGNAAVDTVLAALEAHNGAPFVGRFFIDPVMATVREGEVFFLNSLINRLAVDIYGDEYAHSIAVPTGSRAFSIIQHAIDSKAGDVPGAYGQSFSGDYFAPFDHFMCYRAKTTPGTPRFPKVEGLTLADQFETGTFDAKKPAALCAPANKNDEGLREPAIHLEAYRIKGAAPHARQTGVVVTDQFGTLTLDTIKPDRLLVPSGKALGAPASPPAGTLDHFKCYKVRTARGTPRFEKRSVSVSDQFETRQYDVKRPSHLCNPVDKNGGGIANAEGHLMCYRARAARTEPKHARVEGQIHTNNQFGADQQLDTIKEEQLCLPAEKNLPAGAQGWERTVRRSLSTLASGGIPMDETRQPCVKGSNTPPCSRYRHPVAGLFPGPMGGPLEFEPTPQGNRGTWEQIVDVGPVVNGEFIFPLGQSGHIEGTLTTLGTIDPHVTSLQPIWRDWRFVPMLHVAEDLATDPNGDVDGDGVLDGYERWYFGNVSQGATADGDADGLDLLGEFLAGSDPGDSDTDDDAILDGADGKPQDRLMP